MWWKEMSPGVRMLNQRKDGRDLSTCKDSVEMRIAVDFLQEQFRQLSLFLGREMEDVPG
jgi:hypothetical protein